MHKRLVNHCTIELTLSPRGPILIKSGKEGADPTKPQMEFVETYHKGGRSIYLPGSSLKGAIRAHAERIVRSVSDGPDKLWAIDPLDLDAYEYLKEKKSQDIYGLSSFTDQMFGSVYIASRVRIEDAYPVDKDKLKVEERNGVAIDRVFGSVAVGPFDYQVCTVGDFRTKLHLKNFTLAQLGLIGLVLRDLKDGWFGLGFAKSRGMGSVSVSLQSAVVQYPGCIVDSDTQQIRCLRSSQTWAPTTLLGASQFFNVQNEVQRQEKASYGYDKVEDDIQTELPVSAKEMELGFGVQLTWSGQAEVEALFTRAVKSWSKVAV